MERRLGLIPGIASDLAEALKEARWRIELIVHHNGRPVHSVCGVGRSLDPHTLQDSQAALSGVESGIVMVLEVQQED
jgi:hypothetical protein